LQVRCVLCSRNYELDQSDPQYRKFVNKETKVYVCKRCNAQSQNEAISTTGIDPNLLDPEQYDKIVP
jgi:uncharacterized protein YlaI